MRKEAWKRRKDVFNISSLDVRLIIMTVFSRCMDVDGDGYISMYELEYFYEEQMQRMEAIGIETLPFSDCLCQV